MSHSFSSRKMIYKQWAGNDNNATRQCHNYPFYLCNDQRVDHLLVLICNQCSLAPSYQQEGQFPSILNQSHLNSRKQTEQNISPLVPLFHWSLSSSLMQRQGSRHQQVNLLVPKLKRICLSDQVMGHNQDIFK